MTKRLEHTFQFRAEDVSMAAYTEADYHRKKIGFWEDEYNKAVEKVKATAGVKIVEQQVTGGTRSDVAVDYGDPVAYRRMQEAWTKIQEHKREAEGFETEARLYGSQPTDRSYELDASDVHYFRLGGDPRPE